MIFYKSYEGKTEREVLALQLEIEKLKCISILPKISEKINLNDFCNRTAVQGLIIGAAMAWFVQLTGCSIIINYSTLVFFKSNDMMNSHIASIILGCVQVFGGVLSSFASDTIGRKVLLIISLLGSALGLLALSLYSYLDHVGYDLSHYWSLPVVFLSFVIFTSCIGIGPLSNVCTVENLPQKVNKILIIITIEIFLLRCF